MGSKSDGFLPTGAFRVDKSAVFFCIASACVPGPFPTGGFGVLPAVLRIGAPHPKLLDEIGDVSQNLASPTTRWHIRRPNTKPSGAGVLGVKGQFVSYAIILVDLEGSVEYRFFWFVLVDSAVDSLLPICPLQERRNIVVYHLFVAACKLLFIPQEQRQGNALVRRRVQASKEATGSLLIDQSVELSHLLLQFLCFLDYNISGSIESEVLIHDH